MNISLPEVPASPESVVLGLKDLHRAMGLQNFHHLRQRDKTLGVEGYEEVLGL